MTVTSAWREKLRGFGVQDSQTSPPGNNGWYYDTVRVHVFAYYDERACRFEHE